MKIKPSNLISFIDKPRLYASSSHYRFYLKTEKWQTNDLCSTTFIILDVRKPPDPKFPPMLVTGDMEKAIKFWNNL